jgi:hypothetical protein
MSKKNDGPKILVIDIETTPMIGYFWGLFDQNIGLEQVLAGWSIMAFAAKWYGEDEPMIYMDQRKNLTSKNPLTNALKLSNDKKMVRKIADLLDEADIVLGQNSKGFDTKKINSRIKFHNSRAKKKSQRIEIPSSYKHLDTMLLNKKHFSDTSNKLEYMSNTYNNKYKKLDHKEYPGFKLWGAAMAGEKKVWPVIEKYNKFDVLSTEEYYTDNLRAWDNSINFNVYREAEDTVCTCGSKNFKLNGFSYTSVGKYRRYKCKDCGSELKSRVSELTKEKRASLKIGTVR